jgi:hypothetical protein
MRNIINVGNSMNTNREKSTILNIYCINPNKIILSYKGHQCNSTDIKIWLLYITNVKKVVVPIERV